MKISILPRYVRIEEAACASCGKQYDIWPTTDDPDVSISEKKQAVTHGSSHNLSA